MYFGSVKFFKHLIYLISTLFIIALLVLMSVFVTNSFKDKLNLNTVPAVNDDTQTLIEDSSSMSEEMVLDNIYEGIKALGYSTDEVLNAIEKNNSGMMDRVFKEHYSNSEENLEYIDKFPELYVNAPKEFKTLENTVYLTFDDGPSENTIWILKILEKYNIKATFFVSGDESQRSKEILEKVVEAGHSIGIHSYSHNYNLIYQDVDNFLEDLNDTYNFVYNAVGIKPDIIRFAGGSINAYNKTNYQQIIAEITRRGFVYYDWNVSGEDAAKDANWTSIYNNVLKSVKGKSRAIVLLHDGADKQKTVTVVEDLIIALQKKGYKFDKLTNDVMPITFGYID